MIKDQDNFSLPNNMEDQLEVVYYTDPLCCWSWAFEPQWRRLRFELEGVIKWRYCMGGLISSWKAYNDPMNSISRPAQMGPLWMEASHISGMPIDATIWIQNFPDSSYPACIAFKCAELQSAEAGELYLRALREAVMTRRKNISATEVLLELAEELAADFPDLFELDTFKQSLQSTIGKEKFTEDLKEIRFHQIGRYPTLIIKNVITGRAVIIVGYRPYKVLLEAIKAIAPDLSFRKPQSKEEYQRFWPKMLEREINEIRESELKHEKAVE